MNILLPKESHGRRLEFARLKHPRTAKSAKFLIDKEPEPVHVIYESTRVGDDARSAIIEDQVYTDGSVVVATPFHPSFLMIPALYEQRKRALPLDVLSSLSSDDQTESLEADVFATYMDSICDDTSSAAGQYMLDMKKLKTWLDVRVQRSRAGLPPMVKSEVLKAVRPLNPAEQPSREIIDACETYAAVSMLTMSWLSPEVAEWYLDSNDFSILEAEVKRLEAEQFALSGAQIVQSDNGTDSKRSHEGKPSSNAKRAKMLPVVKNNTSILDMFKARPSKSS